MSPIKIRDGVLSKKVLSRLVASNWFPMRLGFTASCGSPLVSRCGSVSEWKFLCSGWHYENHINQHFGEGRKSQSLVFQFSSFLTIPFSKVLQLEIFDQMNGHSNLLTQLDTVGYSLKLSFSRIIFLFGHGSDSELRVLVRESRASTAARGTGCMVIFHHKAESTLTCTLICIVSALGTIRWIGDHRKSENKKLTASVSLVPVRPSVGMTDLRAHFTSPHNRLTGLDCSLRLI